MTSDQGLGLSFLFCTMGTMTGRASEVLLGIRHDDVCPALGRAIRAVLRVLAATVSPTCFTKTLCLGLTRGQRPDLTLRPRASQQCPPWAQGQQPLRVGTQW